MATIFGNFGLWLCLILSILQLVNSSNNSPKLVFYNRILSTALIFSMLLSFLSLVYSHVISDFSLMNVFQNSHSSKPLIYKITGVWGNHEGSMLLWVLVLVFFNYFLFKLYRKDNIKFVSKSLQMQSVIIIGFLLFIILTSNPFIKLNFVPSNGLGFNPILQDPALAIHPPLLYIGYVGLSAVFSLAIAALSLKNNEEIFWSQSMKPFVIGSWSFLTSGIALGSIWAYYELGWGGWWFWDPVENAALMPWLLTTALMHSILSVERKKSLQTWVLLLALVSFILCVLGTFLVRSGILTSVHTFALDPSRGVFILSLVFLLGFYAFIIFAMKARFFINKNNFIFLSKEGLILVNNLIMIIVCASIFVGTAYPLVVDIFTQDRISVGEPYFNSTIIPMVIPAIIIMGIVPFLNWGGANFDKAKLIKILLLSLSITSILTAIFFLHYNRYNFYGFIGVFSSSWIISNVLISMFYNIFKNQKIKKSLFINFLYQFNSMNIAHIGFGIFILGITGSSVWQDEQIKRMNIGDKLYIKNYEIIFEKIDMYAKANYIALSGNFKVLNNDKKLITELSPENRVYPITKKTTTEVSIHSNLIRDLYIVLGEGDKTNGWTVRLYYNPLVIWIWIGVFIIFIGGVVALKNNLKFRYEKIY